MSINYNDDNQITRYSRSYNEYKEFSYANGKLVKTTDAIGSHHYNYNFLGKYTVEGYTEKINFDPQIF